MERDFIKMKQDVRTANFVKYRLKVYFIENHIHFFFLFQSYILKEKDSEKKIYPAL